MVDQVAEALGANSTEDEESKKVWDILDKGLDEFLEANSTEEVNDTEIINGVASANGDVAAQIAELIFDSIEKQKEKDKETVKKGKNPSWDPLGWGVPPPFWVKDEESESKTENEATAQVKAVD